jgi:hypothetical protein
MINYEFTRRNATQFVGVTGLPLADFDALLPRFESELENYLRFRTLAGKPRRRRYSPQKADLAQAEMKLFFILYYMKNNSLQHTLAATFETSQPQVNLWIKILTPLLEKALKGFVPSTVESYAPPVELGEVVVLDATERPIPRDTYVQEETYSGKQHDHTIKNLALCTVFGTLLWVSPCFGGRVHDKKMADQFSLPPDNVILADLGFQGLQKTYRYIRLPVKKTKNVPLNLDDKQYNYELNSERVIIENVFGSVKIMRIVKDVFRGRRPGDEQTFFLIACGLHNFRKRGNITKLAG